MPKEDRLLPRMFRRRRRSVRSAQAERMCWLWANNPFFDEATRKKALQIYRDEDQMISHFGFELSFGTGGLRSLLGVGTARMNAYTVARVTQGLSDYLTAQSGERVAISYDSRNFSREFAQIAAGVLGKNGIQSHLFNRLMPTPLLSYAIRVLRCDAGIMITASHNSKDYNGYKVFGPDGCQVTDEAAAKIAAQISKVDYLNLGWLDEGAARQKGLLLDVPEDVIESYLTDTLALRQTSAPAQCHAAYTPLNGTGLEPVREIIRRMGAPEMAVVPEQSKPDGDFPTCPLPNPEHPEALTHVIRLARQVGAQLALATDPDCDRVGVVSVNQNGSDRIISGNEIGLLLMDYLLKMRPQSEERPIVLKTIVTSDLAFDIARKYDAKVLEVLTGFKYIGEVIGRLEALNKADQFVLGFEESCGYLTGRHVRDKDGVQALMLILDMASMHRSEGRSLADAVDRIYEEHGYMINDAMSFQITDVNPKAKLALIMRELRDHPPAIMGQAPIEKVVDYIEGLDHLPPSNVLSFINTKGDKIIIRPSGTEPKLKAYFTARGERETDALIKIERLKEDVLSWLEVEE